MTGKVKKVLFFVFLVVIIAVAAFLFLKIKRTNSEIVVTTTPGNIFSKGTPTPKVISNDFPPLYPGVEWNPPKSVDEIVFRTDTGKLVTLSGIYINSTHGTVYDERFFEFYLTELKKMGWTENDSAGGPEGELYHLQMSNKYMTIGYRVTKDKPGLDGKITSYQYYLQYSQ